MTAARIPTQPTIEKRVVSTRANALAERPDDGAALLRRADHLPVHDRGSRAAAQLLPPRAHPPGGEAVAAGLPIDIRYERDEASYRMSLGGHAWRIRTCSRAPWTFSSSRP